METVNANNLFEFLSELADAALSRGDQEVFRLVDRARKHYMVQLASGKSYKLPLTSEFFGVSMVALRDLLETSRAFLTLEQARQAEIYVNAIKEKWFSR